MKTRKFPSKKFSPEFLNGHPVEVMSPTQVQKCIPQVCATSSWTRDGVVYGLMVFTDPDDFRSFVKSPNLARLGSVRVIQFSYGVTTAAFARMAFRDDVTDLGLMAGPLRIGTK